MWSLFLKQRQIKSRCRCATTTVCNRQTKDNICFMTQKSKEQFNRKKKPVVFF